MVRMGLNERRKIKELQEVTFPGRVKEIEEICGAPIPYEVDWDSLSDDLEGLADLQLRERGVLFVVGAPRQQ